MTPDEIAREIEREMHYASNWLGERSVEHNRALIAKAIAAERSHVADAMQCAEVLCTFAGVIPSECGPTVERCDSESCGQCRALDACAQYMNGATR